MYKMSLDFSMAKYDHEDSVLRAIAKEALNFFSRHIDISIIRCILLTGSVANGEGTVIEHNNCMVTSDFDFVIYMKFSDFLRKRTYLSNLSQQITTRLMKRGIQTHILFVPATSVLAMASPFANTSIYEYEYAFASKCLFGKTPQFDKTKRPTNRDAMELTFTVVSDLVFSNLKEISKIEKSYIYAKRALTLLNSLLIFHGLFAETYQKRMKIARKCTALSEIPLNQDEMKTLEILTEYKVSGSFQQLLDSLACTKTDDLISFQREFLKKLTTKILYYELNNILDKTTQTKPEYSFFLLNMTCRFPALLKKYSRHSRARPLSRIMGIALCLFWSLARNRKRKELFATFVFHKQPPKIILNVLIALLFIYGRDISARKILRETLPWINFNNETETELIQRIFSLWQFAEQSIKL